MNSTRGSTPPNPNFDLSNRSTDLNKTLGMIGKPHEESIAMVLSTITCQIKRNQTNPTKNSSNPRTSRTPKSSPLTHGFGRGIKGKRTTKGSDKFPPSNPQEQVHENTSRKPPRKGSENHHQEQPGTTQQNLEEPRRIIYTYQGGSCWWKSGPKGGRRHNSPLRSLLSFAHSRKVPTSTWAGERRRWNLMRLKRK
jgi:hypothetical protein